MKLNLNTILQLIALILAILGFSTVSGIAPLVIGFILLIGGLSLIGFLRMKNEEKGTTIINGLIWAVTMIIVINASGYLGSGNADTGNSLAIPFNDPGEAAPAQADGATATAKWVFYPGNLVGAAYAGSGYIYILDASMDKGTETATTYNFMKMLNDGKTGDLKAPGNTAQSIKMTVSSGAFTKNQLTAPVGSKAVICGALDATPAEAEELAFCKTITLKGISGGSTPEWMWSFNDGSTEYSWYEYATTAWYNYADTAVTAYVEDEDSTTQKTFSFSTFPTNNGESIHDAALYVESPSSTAGAITKIKISAPDGNSVEYTALQSTGQMSSSDPRFTAAPSLTTSTDTMYYVGAFPLNANGIAAVRTSTTDKAKYNIEVTYDHPATAANVVIFKAVQNAGALSSAGGHFDFGTILSLNMTTAGTDAWT